MQAKASAPQQNLVASIKNVYRKNYETVTGKRFNLPFSHCNIMKLYSETASVYKFLAFHSSSVSYLLCLNCSLTLCGLICMRLSPPAAAAPKPPPPAAELLPFMLDSSYVDELMLMRPWAVNKKHCYNISNANGISIRLRFKALTFFWSCHDKRDRVCPGRIGCNVYVVFTMITLNTLIGYNE